MKHFDFDIVVVGGGHAGIEAALAASRMEKKVALVTMDSRKLALMSCNPAIGGLGKSHIVKEMDALGGLMGQAIDATGIQFRKLNLSRGPAVWSTRAQADRIAYAKYVSDFVAADKNIYIIEGIADSILSENGGACGVTLKSGEKIFAQTVILCTGTFLSGLIHIGRKQIKAGRSGEPAAYGLSDSLRSLKFEVGRLKTGTPPRLDGKTIDFSKCQIQPGMNPVPFFSYRSEPHDIQQVSCHLTYTTEQTKKIILDNLKHSAMFSGQIKSTGPRYCPSIEDKIYRFSDKPRHHIFLEPEGNGTDEIYPNGFSTSLPENVQESAIRSVIGLEEAVITRPGYAIEYDYCPSYQIKASLETKLADGLFFAGQINGTSGYEEAAGLGIIAGINAVLKIENEPPFILDRAESYIGVMIDDLITRSTTEPYRMFTSRAEYRLRLREDNARDRLFDYAIKYRLIPQDDFDNFRSIQNETDETITKLRRKFIPVAKLGELSEIFVRKDQVSFAELLKIPGITFDKILPLFDGEFSSLTAELMERVAVKIRYEGYIKKQEREVDKFRRMEDQKIPTEIAYAGLSGLRNEAREKFERFRPVSLGQAGRIEGITVGDVAALSIHLRKFNQVNSHNLMDNN